MNDLIMRKDIEQMLKDLGGCDASDKEAAGWDKAIGAAMEGLRKVESADKWIPCNEKLPENAKHKASLCPKYQVNTEHGVTEGWYNPNVESWYCLFWFLLGIYDENDINFERGDIPKVVKISKNTDIVTAWKPLPEPWKGENND